MATILDGKALAEDIYKDLEVRINHLKEKNITPGLAILDFGEESGQAYVRNKVKTCERLGIDCEHIQFNPEVDWNDQSGMIEMIMRLNERKDIHGIIVQLPIPDCYNVNPGALIETIKPCKDVDGLTSYNVARMWTHSDGYPYHYPCTPTGILHLLNHYNVPLRGKNVTIIGRSELVGKPLAAMLMESDATVTVCHSKTAQEDISWSITGADIVVCAVGNPEVMRDYYIGEGTIIDVGINRVDGKIVGDISEDMKKYAEGYTPVPGGVGPMTVAKLMEHVVRAAEVAYLAENY